MNRTELATAALQATARFEEFSEIRIVHRLEFRPTNLVPIVYLERHRRVLDYALWGFVPSWGQGDIKIKPINAKSETAAVSSMFRDAFMSCRCLLPADGFFEPKGLKGPKQREQYYFHRPDEAIFAMAGLWSQSAVGLTCTILTTTPNAPVGEIHQRMPVIVQANDYDAWLNPGTGVEALQALLRPAPDADFVYELASDHLTAKVNVPPGLFDELC